MIISSRSSASLHLDKFTRTGGNVLMCTIVRWFHGARAFHKPVHFILQDRVHHHVSGCCHPGNVSLTRFSPENQSLVVWLHRQPKWERLPPGAWLQTRVGFVFISMWPRFLAVQTQYGCFRGETTCCISEHRSFQSSCLKRFRCWLHLTTIPCHAGPRWDSLLMNLRCGRLQWCLHFL